MTTQSASGLDSVLTLSQRKLGIMQPRPLTTAHVGGDLTVDGWLNVNNLAVAQNATVGGTLAVTGAVTLGGSLTVTGTTALNNHTTISQATGTVGSAGSSEGQLELQNAGSGASKIAFHRTGAYAAYFGVDTDNIWKVGGWSAGANAWRVVLGDNYGNAGALSMAGTISGSGVTARAGYLHTTDGSNGIVMSDNGSLYVRGANGAVVMDGSGGLSVSGGTLVVAGAITTNGNQLYINGAGLTQETARGYAALMTNTGQGDFVLGGGQSILYMHSNLSVYIAQNYPYFDIVGFTTVRGPGFEPLNHLYWFDAAHAVNITWNGTYLNHSHSIQFNVTGNQIVWPNGSYISGSAGYVQGSSLALKESIAVAPDTDLLGLVSDDRLPVSTYRWRGDESLRRNIGFIADDMAKVLPSYVMRDDGGRASGYNPQELTAILWGAVRALSAKVAALES